MKIARKSIISNEWSVMDLDITLAQLLRYENGEGYIQTIFPHLSPGEREFIKSGISPDEWDTTFKLEEDEEIT